MIILSNTEDFPEENDILKVKRILYEDSQN